MAKNEQPQTPAPGSPDAVQAGTQPASDSAPETGQSSQEQASSLDQQESGKASREKAPVEQSEAKQPIHPGEERVTIVLHRGPQDAKKTHQSSAVNTERVEIPFEKPVRLKRKFLWVLQDAVYDHLVVTDENREMIQEIVPANRFGVSVRG